MNPLQTKAAAEAKLHKLPRWAQDYIEHLQRERDAAVRTLHDCQDQQTPSAFYCQHYECTGEQAGPSLKRQYVQTQTIFCETDDLWLRIHLSQDRPSIELHWSDVRRGMADVAIIPTGFCQAMLLTKDSMRA